jgi:hypothetical protein
MLSFADMMDFLSNELPGLGRWRLSFSLVAGGPFDGSFFRHISS